MCGIVGFFTHKRFDHHRILGRMVNFIHHRGPDDEGTTINLGSNGGIVGLGHKRLSIIDLSIDGRQPMNSFDGRLFIVFNGEIYNYQTLRADLENDGYQFKTKTDTEVILNMYLKYGPGCLNYFNGMFAFAIYDRTEDSIFIARDRLGIRPLYYYHQAQTFVFASEIKALLEYPEVPREADYSRIGEYVQHRYVRNPNTLFANILKLEPGHYLIFKGDKLEKHRYWDIDDFNKARYSTLQEALESMEQLLTESVKLRMISDVPFGAFLSGGIDSSLIVALMSRFSSMSVKTFSVGLRDSKMNELPYAKKIAGCFNTDHHELIVTEKEIMDILEKAVWHRDAPVSEPSDIPIFLLAEQAKKSVSVILTGEGSDEVFAGYPKYAYDHLADKRIFTSFFKNNLIKRVVNNLPYRFRKEKLAYNTLIISDEHERFANWFASIGQAGVEALLSNDYQKKHPKFPAKFPLKGLTHLDRMLYFDIRYWLTDNLLERADKMMMASAIEGRVPFLDYNVVEAAFRLKDEYKISGKVRKFVVKKLAEKYIPSENIYRKKVGFYIPVGDWFRSGLRELLSEHLLTQRFIQRDIFNQVEIKRMVDAHIQGKINYEKELWMLLNLEMWFRTYIDCKS